ncbi:MAG TPA: MobF family relaxase [Candidatus Binataceae bacterium]|nr:MobF family relaxase [Candidatus Binataceae bacterium]
MLVMSKGALTAGQAETYYEEKYSRDDYYTEKRRVVGRWFGKGAAELGLGGEVDTKDFRAVLGGLDPSTGEIIVHAAQREGEQRRAGWDATFNAPKSVSVQALVGDDSRLIAAHRRSVERALEELERFAQARIQRGQEWVTTANVVAARFDHIAARPTDAAANDGYGPDPHLHTHVVVMNMTRRPDGAWRGLDPVEIYRSQAFATAVYRAELAREVQKLGYAIVIAGSDGRWELEGYGREQVMAFSLRRQEIERELAKLGVNGAAAAQIAAHRSRLSKDQRDEQALKAEWRERAAAYGIPIERIAAVANNRGTLSNEIDAQKLDEAVRHATAHAVERDAAPDRRELEAFALQHAMGRTVLERVRSAIDAHRSDGRLIDLAADHRHPIGAFTTPRMAALEQDNIALMREGRGQGEAIASADEIRRRTARRGLAADQTSAAGTTLSTRDWLSAIEGRAGAAKTTTVGAIRELARERGWFVRGFGPTSGSVKALSEAGVLARTVASLLENPGVEKHGRELWIVDESSLLATRQVNRLLHLAKVVGVERVVFVGDERQHHAIEAGRPLHQMRQAGMTTVSLTVIRRQRDPQLRHAVELAAAGKLAETISALSEQQRINAIAPPVERYRAIAEDYLRSHQAGQTTLVVSPAIEERTELNQVIREILVERGTVAREGIELATLSNLDLTRAQRAHARHYAAGDVIRFRRGSAKLGVAAGGYATVEALDTKRNLLRIKNESGAIVEYAPGRFRGVEAFRAESRNLAAGDRIQFRAPDRALGVANGELATVVAIDAGQIRLRTDKGREIAATNTRLRHIDYGYASTSHASQGATVDRVIINVDTERSVRLVNRRQFYVSLSRARHDARIYTDNADALARAVGREQLKPTALENLSPAQRRSLPRFKPFDIEEPFAARLKQGVGQDRKLKRSQGIRW